MISFCVFLAFVTAGSAERGTTVDLGAVDAWNAAVESSSKPLPLRVTYDGRSYNAIDFHLLLPPLTSLVMRCDPSTLTLADTLEPDYGLTGNARAAVQAAPRWLRPSLVDNLSELTASKQDVYADMILAPSDARLRDETAFQVAHISPGHLLIMNPEVITGNLDSLFAIDDDLEYVQIVDYGSPDSDDYYSTTRYKALDEGSLVEFELPREIYYWYVVHPRGTDELAKIIYGKFWREYLYYNNGTTSYTENPDTPSDPYPLLRDVLADIDYLWDGNRCVWPSERELSPDMCALDAVGWWVSRMLPQLASNPRPIQPNELATDHDGNCGECQDLYWAGLRTGLIPALGVMDVNEDHVWNAFWYPLDPAGKVGDGEVHSGRAFGEEEEGGGWYPCQVDLGGGVTHAADSGCAYDKDRGASKYCSMIWNWRGDGYQQSSIETYSNSCTLTVKAYDTQGRPVPNTDVKLLSEGWLSLMRVKGFSGITDRDGQFTTTLGEEQNYYASVYMESLGKIIDSAASLAGSHFFVACTLKTNYKPQPREIDFTTHSRFPIEGEIDTTLSPPPDEVSYLVFLNNYAEMGEVISGTVSFAGSDLHLHLKAEYDLGHCPTYSYEETLSQSAVEFAPGRLTDFIITDLAGVRALGVSESAEPRESPDLLGPTLVTDESPCFKITGCTSPVKLAIFDKLGRRIHETSVIPDASHNASFTWEGRTGQPCGVYFLQVSSANEDIVHKFVLLR